MIKIKHKITGEVIYTYSGESLRGANLKGTYLRNADLRYANLKGASLINANLINADMEGASLINAKLISANLRNANLRGVDLDFSYFPLWCGGIGWVVDERLPRMLAAFICSMKCDNKEIKEMQKMLLPYARKSHRAEEILKEGE